MGRLFSNKLKSMMSDSGLAFTGYMVTWFDSCAMIQDSLLIEANLGFIIPNRLGKHGSK